MSLVLSPDRSWHALKRWFDAEIPNVIMQPPVLLLEQASLAVYRQCIVSTKVSHGETCTERLPGSRQEATCTEGCS